MGWVDTIKTVGITVASGTITASLIFAGNRFYKGVMLLINLDEKYTHHEEKITALVKATTIDIPTQIRELNTDISKTHELAVEVFTSEITPLISDVKEIKIDIFNLKKHTNYPENGHQSNT